MDVVDTVRKLDLPTMLVELMSGRYSPRVRQLANQSISMLTYHESLCQVLIQKGVIDLAMDPCLEGTEDLSVMQFSTQVLIHFALNGDSIQILLEKGMMKFFSKLEMINEQTI